ncbi:cellulose biosynthesis cyclic di-GMP-binding regulatory protein BcsB [Lysinibacillus sp. HST-98]|uniref:cellulose biosynthesis cyclic di-GMP-binding regulatory protein BcsB n=1 Tax=Lysinibacillus sp. HST-98 TaxID=2800419 RepID=UPI001927CC75|nr:cellulose biosynthesis cyclic di-GMP-binding regulatory protein BcsB [Lysinibacillus sp. HST-98]MBL3728552.1 cellulose biosynthesis cyclic di-GMP-binding regulatory protein BcsB [Lysinibacillus sp. HST-98]
MRTKFFYLCLFCIVFFSFANNAVAATITVDDNTIVIEGNQQQKKPLLAQPIELLGPSSSRDFYYNLNEDVPSNNQQVTFQIQHSELLIAPSSFTVKVDDVAIKTVPLKADSLKQTVTVNLPKEALLKGSHKITASFYGILKEGICVPPGNAGNWLRIEILSSISAFSEESDAWSLNSYPAAFLGYEGYATTVIVPKQTSEATLNSAYQLAAFLSEHGDTDVQIEREDAFNKIRGPIIIVGAKKEFSTSLLKKMLANISVEQDTMTLTMQELLNTNSNRKVPLLAVTSSNGQAIEERLSFLTEATLFEQLIGDTLAINDVPKIEESSDTTISFKQFGFEDRLLSSQATMTPHYYVSLPKLEANKEAFMRLIVKKSATIPDSKEDEDRKLELIAYINNVPHAVDLRKLEQTTTDMYEAIIPIQTNVLNKLSMTDIQFEVTGFQLEDPCETTNERYWIYIDSDSTLSITKDDAEPTFTLRDFPNAFHENTLIVIPDNGGIDDTTMVSLYKSLMTNGNMAKTSLMKDKNVTEEALQGHAVIFMGEMEQLTWLSKQASKIPHTSEQLISQGFLPEAIGQYVFITKNFWQQKEPLLWIHSLENASVKGDFYAHLKETNSQADAAIETKEGQFVVAVDQNADKEDVKVAKKGEISYVLIAEFVGLILVIAVILYIILRKRKKNQLKQ